MTQTILIVEDEEKLAHLLRDYLTQNRYQAVCLGDGLEVVPWVRENRPDLVLLDLMLPERDGLEICKDIRTFTNLPIIMVTARVEEIDRLLGLELGADDYICKPFSPREVVARVKAVLRRVNKAATEITTGDLVIDESRYKAIVNGRDLGLTAVEFQLFAFLAANPDRLYSRSQLMDRIYTDGRIVSERTIDSHIKKLRRKISLTDPKKELIYSVYGVGYKFSLNE